MSIQPPEAPSLLTEIDASVTSLLQKVGEDGSVSDRIDAIKVASTWIAQRAKLEPTKPATGGGKFDKLRTQFHGGTTQRGGSRAKAATGGGAPDDGEASGSGTADLGA
jgi:hypothetical protein